MRSTFGWIIVGIIVVGSVVYAWLQFRSPIDAVIIGLTTLIGALAAWHYKAGPAPAPPKPEAPTKPSAEPLRLLALLQREGRLVDFLMEDISGYADPQVGAAVRDIHRQCGSVLKEHLVIEPVLPQKEEEAVTVPAGFDPSAIRLTGNVTGQPPFTGALKHHGWRVRQLKLSPPPEGQDEFVLMPAEVELA